MDAGKKPDIELCRWNDDLELPPPIYDEEPDYLPSKERPFVYHVFGHLRDPDSLVLTEDDYFDFLIGVTKNNDMIPHFVRSALTHTALLFLGFRLDEWDFRTLFRSLMSQEGRNLRKQFSHVAVQIDPEEGQMSDPERARAATSPPTSRTPGSRSTGEARKPSCGSSRSDPGPAPMTATVQAGLNPYVGPRVPAGKTLYGRDREVLELLDLVLAERIVLLHSPSGAGKTSLIQAALIPRLEQEGFEILPVIRVSLKPPVGTDTGEGFNRYVFSALLSLEEDVPADKQLDVADLARMSLDHYLSRRPATADNRVLIFDQFEEVLLNPADQPAKRQFFHQLGAALRPQERWALIAMRDDYVAALDPYLGAFPPRPDQISASTSDPAGGKSGRAASGGAGRITFSEGAVSKPLMTYARSECSSRMAPASRGPVPTSSRYSPGRLPPAVGSAQARAKGDPRVGHRERGDVDMALSVYYAQQVADVARRTGVSERSIRDWFDSPLIVEQRFRGQAREGPQDSIDNVQPVLRLLGDAHLIRAEQRRGFHLVRAGARPAGDAGPGRQRTVAPGAPACVAAAGGHLE